MLYVETADLSNLNKEVREQYQAISNRFAALGNLDHNGDINRAWENIRDNIKITA
jgi:hypothetical protein